MMMMNIIYTTPVNSNLSFKFLDICGHISDLEEVLQQSVLSPHLFRCATVAEFPLH